MKVLVACEESQTVCKAFRERGHEAYSCDMQEPSGGHPEWHVCGDASALLSGGGGITTMDGATHYIDRWDLLIAHPPCTYLTNAGARHLWKDHQLQPERVKLGIMARDLFMRFWWADIPRIVIENPVPSSIFCLPEYTQIINPHQFYGADHPYTKKTCLWEKGVEPLVPVEAVEPEKSRVLHMKNGTVRRSCWVMDQNRDRAKTRSKTFPGIARAMAEQWG